jgi:hypothetical protein
MRTIDDIRAEIERASERRAELYRALSKGHDSALAAELKDIGVNIDGLWDEHRAVKAELRFGPRENIRKRARAEERLERAA